MPGNEFIDEDPLEQGLLVRVSTGFMSGLRFVRDQLSDADLNPHEGQLRAEGKIVEVELLDILGPSPVDDDTP